MLHSQNDALISKGEKPENLGGLAFFKVGIFQGWGGDAKKGGSDPLPHYDCM